MALNTEFFVKMPLGQKLLILAVVVALIVLGYWFGIDTDLSEQLDSKRDELAAKKNDLAKLETVEKNRKKLERELQNKELELEKAKEKLPTETEMEKLFLTISELGQENGITFQTFQPGTESTESNLYKVVPISLNFYGSYAYVLNFFYEVTHLPRIVRFEGIKISPKGLGNEISVSVTAKTFKFAGK